jgi:hypothetical protein
MLLSFEKHEQLLHEGKDRFGNVKERYLPIIGKINLLKIPTINGLVCKR